MPTGSWKRKLISMLLAAKFQDNLMLKPKRPIFKNYGKNTLFLCIFWISTYVNKAQRWYDNHVKEAWKNHCRNHRFLNKKARIFGLDVGTRNFEVLGKILASILGVLGRSWGRLGASWAPLRSSWASLWRQNRYKKAATPPNEKNSETMGPKIRERRHGDLRVGRR